MKRKGLWITTLVALCLLGAGLSKRAASKSDPKPPRKISYYQDSMHPWVKSDQPGKCTICGMDLTPVHEGDQAMPSDDIVSLKQDSITVLNVRTEEVQRQNLHFSIRVAGTLDADETRKSVFSAPAAGRIEQMAIESVGDEVGVDQRLFTFYSPELANWRRAYVIRNRSTTLTTPYFAGRPHEGQDVSERPKPASKAGTAIAGSETDPYISDLVSPLSGTVVERKVFNGQYVSEGDRLLTIVDTSVLWFRFDVYEQQLAWLHKGQNVKVVVPAVPGHEFLATISVIEPTLDERTRTAKVRADLVNPKSEYPSELGRMLKLGMYADGWVQADLPAVVTVPRSAVLYPGGRPYVYVQAAPKSYTLRELHLGRCGDEEWEVRSGIQPGERVVTSGNVLLDAQAQITRPHPSDPVDVAQMSQRATSVEPEMHVSEMPLVHAAASDAAKPPSETHAFESSKETGTPVAARSLNENFIENPSNRMLEHHAMDAERPNRIAGSHAEDVTVGSFNTRHPDAKERMARAFGLGLAGVHRNMTTPEPSSSAVPVTLRAPAVEPPDAEPQRRSAAGETAVHNAHRQPEPAPSRPPVEPKPADTLDARQRAALGQLFAVADSIAGALAADDLPGTKQEAERLTRVNTTLKFAFGVSHPWHDAVVQLLAIGDREWGNDLPQARKTFLEFSAKTAALAALARAEDTRFADLKIYHCPMAPKPGLWLQQQGPLGNPFFGSQMLRCGEEVKP